MAACTSRAAPLMSRLRSNCSTIAVEPRLLVDVISVTAAMCPNWRSSGAATEVAIVSGLAPGSAAETWIVGKSTCGSAATGSRANASAPLSASARVNSVVAIGRRMNGSAIENASRDRGAPPLCGGASERMGVWGPFRGPHSRLFIATPPYALGEPVEGEIDDGRGVERQHLAHDQPADDGDAERAPQLRAHA